MSSQSVLILNAISYALLVQRDVMRFHCFDNGTFYDYNYPRIKSSSKWLCIRKVGEKKLRHFFLQKEMKSVDRFLDAMYHGRATKERDTGRRKEKYSTRATNDYEFPLWSAQHSVLSAELCLTNVELAAHCQRRRTFSNWMSRTFRVRSAWIIMDAYSFTNDAPSLTLFRS